MFFYDNYHYFNPFLFPVYTSQEEIKNKLSSSKEIENNNDIKIIIKNILYVNNKLFTLDKKEKSFTTLSVDDKNTVEKALNEGIHSVYNIIMDLYVENDYKKNNRKEHIIPEEVYPIFLQYIILFYNTIMMYYNEEDDEIQGFHNIMEDGYFKRPTDIKNYTSLLKIVEYEEVYRFFMHKILNEFLIDDNRERYNKIKNYTGNYIFREDSTEMNAINEYINKLQKNEMRMLLVE